ncbi:cytosine permease [Planomicrobium sp. YIM 101495]|uniref:cytosine permease n=1 Tax=Planomicrobium sp. YIM 101495 TaxID=2665160 RepID=UPI0012B8D101|nr:cytosine permease [Planomicrobium sp. YIM 101495]MTD30656.1 allantoin permease [Planomicrobium sp. YIM 101495]
MTHIKQEDNRFLSVNPDLLPTLSENRTWNFSHYFSVWMGSVHNIPSYVTIGGFFALGLSTGQVFTVICFAALLVAVLLVLNGHAGNKYGIPFSILLRASYGGKGAILPGFFRGIIAGIMWFGLQTYAGSIAVSIFIGTFYPSYLTLGGDFSFLGLNFSSLLSFLIFWFINLIFIFADVNALGKLTKSVTVLVFVVFGGMSIWSIQLAGGIQPILAFEPAHDIEVSVFLLISCVSAIVATWVAPILSVSDITRYSRTKKAHAGGQFIGIMATYLLFALASISIIIGSEIAFGVPVWNVLEVVDKFDSIFAIILSLTTLALATLSVNIVGNVIPAANQLTALFPRKLSFKKSAFLVAVLGTMLLPWKLMENSTSIFAFLNLVGALLSPVIGVMLTHYYIVSKRKIDIDALYGLSTSQPITSVQIPALLATLLTGGLSLLGSQVATLEVFYSMSSLLGIFISAVLYFSFYQIQLHLRQRKLH